VPVRRSEASDTAVHARYKGPGWAWTTAFARRSGTVSPEPAPNEAWRLGRSQTPRLLPQPSGFEGAARGRPLLGIQETGRNLHGDGRGARW